MPSSSDHLDCAEQHYEAAELLLSHGSYPWATVALFYTALHMVHAGLPQIPSLSVAQQHPDAHGGATFQAEGTNIVVRKYVPALNASYKSLFSASIDVRYYGNQPSRTEAFAHQRTDLRAIAQWACNLVHANPSCQCWLLQI